MTTEFSVYSKRLLNCVPILEARIREVIEGKGDMGLVKEIMLYGDYGKFKEGISAIWE